ncbi:hypothetical protein [Nitrosomonas ureae]|uniref:Uncharacterized protein n=1 Tax=Nitrosomonas ureae TaxID=44577 RepID=A0A286AJF9_9PROT|nr:hypothetical protein [Nitrosomonas ureae]PTQ86902.1 hypothetical protein C8R28_100897 [Nitrosomonas ureae]SOD22030.1 hypothetical protein SAMN06297164_3318 [Nitrosomonas ureae]
MQLSKLGGSVPPQPIPPEVLPTVKDAPENPKEDDPELEIPDQPFQPDKVPPLEEQERDIPQE